MQIIYNKEQLYNQNKFHYGDIFSVRIWSS